MTRPSLKELKNIKKLAFYLHSAIIGLLLSDSHLRGTSLTSNCNFTQWFGIPYHALGVYISYLLYQFTTRPLHLVTRSTGKSSYWLYTRTLPIFRYYHGLFYVWDPIANTFIKRVPVDIYDMMNPIVLAFLIMGDGNYDWSRDRVRIYTNSFTKEDNDRLAESICKLGVVTKVMFDRKSKDGTKDQYILTIGKKQLPLLRKLVLPYTHYSMWYRLGITSDQIK